MDTRRIDEADPAVTFDLLRVCLSDAFDRQVIGANQPGCAWQALTHALRQGARERSRDSRAVADAAAASGASPEAVAAAEAMATPAGSRVEEELTEKDLRQRIVSTYSQQQGSALDALIAAKRADPLSYFFHAGHNNVEEARQHWTWYLYCLTFEVADFCAESPGVDREIVCMPLDLVDLQVVASAFRVQITVARLMEEALRIRPPVDTEGGKDAAELAAHLLVHRGLWAPLLGPRPPEEEVRPLVGAVVQIGNIASKGLEAGCNRAALVVGHDQDNDCYMACVDREVLPIERRQIKWAIFSEREAAAAAAAEAAKQDPPPGTGSRGSGAPQASEPQSGKGGGEGAAAGGDKTKKEKEEERRWWWRWNGPGAMRAYRGIADGAAEFQVLHELVRRGARVRLEKMMQDLAGRTATTKGVSATAPVAPHSSSGLPVPNGRAAPIRHEPLPTPARNRAARQQHAAGAAGAPAPAPAVPLSRRPPAILKRMPLDEAREHVAAGRVVSVVSPSAWEPTDKGQLKVDIGDEVRLSRFHEAWVLASLATPSHSGAGEGWCSSDCLAIWEVHQAFTPEPSWGAYEMFLPLKAGECVVVTSRYTDDWADWAFGTRWGAAEESAGEGLFPLAHVRPRVLLSRVPGT